MKGWPRWALGLPLLVACASTARVTGDFGEYSSYRRTRVATTVEAKLAASQRYLHDYPKGDYADEVRRWFVPAENRYFRLSWQSLPRLRAYLDALPRGPHAEQVGDRITELESRRTLAERREQRVLDRAQSFEQRLAQAADQRRTFLREFAALARSLAGTHGFGQPSSRLEPELLSRFRDRPPSGACEGEGSDHCLQVVRFAYAVPDDQGLLDRNVDLELAVVLDHGQVQQLSLSAPELLTRVAEASQVRAIPADNPQARAEALGRALDIASDALDGPMPASSCAAEAVSPIVLARHCNGVRLEVVAGTEAGAADRLIVRPEKR